MQFLVIFLSEYGTHSASLARHPIRLVGEWLVICWISAPVGGASPLNIGFFWHERSSYLTHFQSRCI